MKVAVLGTGQPSVEVLRFLAESGDVATILGLVGPQAGEHKALVDQAPEAEVFYLPNGGEISLELIEAVRTLEPEAVLSVYWPVIIPPEVVDQVPLTVNFHPSLLPRGRGWYPHVHNIIDSSSAGVSLHELAFPLDSGRLWAQREVEVLPTDLASDLHGRLANAAIDLFKQKWPLIKAGKIHPVEQGSSDGPFLSKNYFEEKDHLDLHEEVTIGDFIRFLRARTWNSTGFAHYYDQGHRVQIAIKLTESPTTDLD